MLNDVCQTQLLLSRCWMYEQCLSFYYKLELCVCPNQIAPKLPVWATVYSEQRICGT